MRRARVAAIGGGAVVAVACVGTVVTAVTAIASEGAHEGGPVAGPSPPPPVGLVVPEPRPLDDAGVTARWATLRRTTVTYAEPAADARPRGRIGGVTPEGTDNVVLIVDTARDASGTAWARTRSAGDPSDGPRWVRASELAVRGVSRARLVVDRARREITLHRGGRVAFRAPVGVGTPATPTPAGSFYVRNRLTRYASPRYGPLAFGTSARSRLSDWPGGGYIGIHGTNRPELLPGAVSHGCIRMRNRDIVRLGAVLRVGTPVTIV